jgi:hypothetical protein
MAATHLVTYSAPPDYITLNSDSRHFSGGSSYYCNSCHKIMLCLHWSLVHQALCVPPEKEIQWSQVRGARGPNYWASQSPTGCLSTGVLLHISEALACK